MTLAEPITAAAPSIRVLDDELISRIAAGEVVERPASILKELVENALDAGATSIRANLEEGGLKLVRVSDDGAGMSPVDLPLSVLPHATSKVTSASDLERLGACGATLGFRGEALPSIASVTKLRLVSRQRSSPAEGWALEPSVEGSSGVRPAAGAFGTTVEARDLFYNLPARRKFLKSPGSEAAACADVFLRLALTRPFVRFELSQGRFEVLNLPAVPVQTDLTQASFQRARAALSQPSDVVLHEVDSSDAPAEGSPADNAYRVHGLLSAPSHSRSNRAQIYLTVNGRAVKDRTLTSALLEACRHFLPPRRYPLCALNVELPANEVDINVHPAKAEVRFRAPGRVYSLLHHAVRHAYGIDVTSLPAGSAPQPVIHVPSVSGYAPPLTPAPRPAPPLLSFASSGPLLNTPHPFNPPPIPKTDGLRVSESPPPFGALQSAFQPAPQPELRSRGDFRIIGQAAASYILVEDESGIHVIDQHALHERILFERLVQRAHALARGDSQRLLVPMPVELSAPQAALISSVQTEGAGLQWLAELGFDCAPFGARTLLVQAVPAILPEHAAVRMLTDLLDELADPELSKSSAPRQAARWTLREKAAYVLSCKAAIKAGEVLTSEQMQALIDEFCLLAGATSLTGHLTCPHGRPLALELSWQEIQRAVGRS